jgi:hypothetical protein
VGRARALGEEGGGRWAEVKKERRTNLPIDRHRGLLPEREENGYETILVLSKRIQRLGG